MTWKDTVNTGLVRLTGYELARPGGRPSSARKVKPVAKGASTWHGKPATSPRLPRDYDDEAVRDLRVA